MARGRRPTRKERERALEILHNYTGGIPMTLLEATRLAQMEQKCCICSQPGTPCFTDEHVLCADCGKDGCPWCG